MHWKKLNSNGFILRTYFTILQLIKKYSASKHRNEKLRNENRIVKVDFLFYFRPRNNVRFSWTLCKENIFFLLHSIFCSYCHIFVGDGLNNVCHTLPPLRNHVTEKLRVRTISLNVCFALLCFEISKRSKLSVSASQQSTKGSKINVM